MCQMSYEEDDKCHMRRRIHVPHKYSQFHSSWQWGISSGLTFVTHVSSSSYDTQVQPIPFALAVGNFDWESGVEQEDCTPRLPGNVRSTCILFLISWEEEVGCSSDFRAKHLVLSRLFVFFAQKSRRATLFFFPASCATLSGSLGVQPSSRRAALLFLNQFAPKCRRAILV